MGLSETDGRNSLSVDVSHAVWRLSDNIRSVLSNLLGTRETVIV